MAKVTVHKFTIWDQQAGENRISRRMGTLDAITKARGAPVPGSATEIDSSELESTEDGMTPIDFDPALRDANTATFTIDVSQRQEFWRLWQTFLNEDATSVARSGGLSIWTDPFMQASSQDDRLLLTLVPPEFEAYLGSKGFQIGRVEPDDGLMARLHEVGGLESFSYNLTTGDLVHMPTGTVFDVTDEGVRILNPGLLPPTLDDVLMFGAERTIRMAAERDPNTRFTWIDILDRPAPETPPMASGVANAATTNSGPLNSGPFNAQALGVNVARGPTQPLHTRTVLKERRRA